MYETMGAHQVSGDAESGAVEFKLFFPDRAREPGQYDITERPAGYANPMVASIRVAGSFQRILGQAPWDVAVAPKLTRDPHGKGWVWRYRTDRELPAGFYEY